MSVGRLTRYSPGGGTCDLGPAYKNAGPPGPQGPQGPPGVPGGVLRIIAGTGITLSPPGGTGTVTVSWIDPGYSTGSGATGIQGPTGPESLVPGPRGFQGVTGPTGPQGIQGPAGPPGTGGGGGGGVSQIVAGSNITISPSGGTGVVTINSAGAAGPQGPQGIQGLQGPAGNAGPQGNAGAVGPAGPAGGVTQIIAGTNITISPTNGLGAVTINSSGGGNSGVYVFKLSFSSGILSPASGSPGAIILARDSSGGLITHGNNGWSLTTNASNSITITPPSSLKGCFGNFHRYTQWTETATGQATDYKLDAFAVAATTGSFVGYKASTGAITFYFGATPNPSTGILSSGPATMYIIMAQINTTNVFI
jgi:hypothetical protein